MSVVLISLLPHPIFFKNMVKEPWQTLKVHQSLWCCLLSCVLPRAPERSCHMCSSTCCVLGCHPDWSGVRHWWLLTQGFLCLRLSIVGDRKRTSVNLSKIAFIYLFIFLIRRGGRLAQPVLESARDSVLEPLHFCLCLLLYLISSSPLLQLLTVSGWLPNIPLQTESPQPRTPHGSVPTPCAVHSVAPSWHVLTWFIFLLPRPALEQSSPSCCPCAPVPELWSCPLQ